MDRIAFINFMREEGMTSGSAEVYASAMERYFERYNFFTDKNCCDYRLFLENTGVSKKTISVRCAAMNKYSNFSGKDIHITAPRMLKQFDKQATTLTLEQFKDLLDKLMEAEDLRGFWMVEFLAKTGARAGELVQLRKECLDEGKATVHYKGRERSLLIPSKLIEEGRDYLIAGPGPFLFPSNRMAGRKMMTPENVEAILSNYGKEYGIEGLYSGSFRQLFAQQMYERTCDPLLVADLLGETLEKAIPLMRQSEGTLRVRMEGAICW